MALDLLCVGAANLDVIVSVDGAPEPDERVEAREILRAGGGPAATAAVAAARQGVSVGFCGRVGRDIEGDQILEGLVDAGIDVSHVERDRDIVSGSSVIIVDLTSAERMICARTAPPPSGVPELDGWLHLDQVGHDALTARSRVRSRVSIDHGNPIPGLDLTGVDLYVPARPMLQAIRSGKLSEAARIAADDSGGQVVITDGAAGAWIWRDDRLDLVDGFALGGPLSTLGAGDVFHGALVAAVIAGHGLPEAVRRANACAALSCRGLDGRSAIPTSAEVEEFLANQPTTHLVSEPQPKGRP